MEFFMDTPHLRHLAEKGISPDEVDEIAADPGMFLLTADDVGYFAMGKTAGGRHLKLVIKRVDNMYFVLTGWPMSRREKRTYRTLSRPRRDDEEKKENS